MHEESGWRKKHAFNRRDFLRLGGVVGAASVAAACSAGAQAEREDAAFYAPFLTRGDLPRDAATVFTNLQQASLTNHLPAFERCQ